MVTEAKLSHFIPQSKLDVLTIIGIRHCVVGHQSALVWSARSMVVAGSSVILGMKTDGEPIKVLFDLYI